MNTDRLKHQVARSLSDLQRSLATLSHVGPRDVTGQCMAVGVMRADLRGVFLSVKRLVNALDHAVGLVDMADDVLEVVAGLESNGCLGGDNYTDLLLAAQALETAKEVDDVAV